MQPLDVALNAEFKGAIDVLQTEHMHNNLEQYVNNSLSASARRVMITKWAGAACPQKKEVIQRAFEKCGISVPIDGSEDGAIKIRGLEGYLVCNTLVATDSESEEDMFELDSCDDECDASG